MESIKKYGVSFIVSEADNDYVITDPWIYWGVYIHSLFDAHDKISWNGFLEDDPDMLENSKDKDDSIKLNENESLKRWLNTEDGVLSFRYKTMVDKVEDTLYMKLIKVTDKKLQINLISKTKDDQIVTHDLDIPDDFNSIKKDIDNLICKFVPKPVETKKKGSLLIDSKPAGTHPSMPFAPGIPMGGPYGGGIGKGGFQPIGGPSDLHPFGGSNLVGPNSSLFKKPHGSGGAHGLIDDDDDDPNTFQPGPFGFGATPDNDLFPNFGGKKGGPGGGFGGGFGPGGFGGSGGTSGGNFFM